MPAVDFTTEYQRYQSQQRFKRDHPDLQIQLRRQGKKIIAENPSDIPSEICLKCGNKATHQHSITLVAEKWILGFFLLILPFPFGLFYKEPEKCEVKFGLCNTHESARKRRIGWLTALTFLMPIVGIVIMASASEMWGSLILISWPVICLYAIFGSRPITGRPTPKGIVIVGAGKKFLDLLPESAQEIHHSSPGGDHR